MAVVCLGFSHLPLSNMAALKILDVSDTAVDMSGGIPSDITDLTTLQELYLGGLNFPTGPISPNWPTSLTALDLSGNSFTGGIPPELSLLQHLSYLNVNENGLTGYLPRG